MFQYCLFDLDGTLTDPGEGITRCVQYALRSLGIEEPDPFVRKILERFDIEKYFDVIVGSELDGARSTKEEVVKEALCRLAAFGLNEGEKKALCAMIGDRKFDIQGAKAHEITGVGVRFGYAPEGELEAAGADYIADTVEELEDFLMGTENSPARRNESA